MACRGVRGATTVERNDREEILTATRQLVALMVRRNGIDKLRRGQRDLHHHARPGRRVSRARGAATWVGSTCRCCAVTNCRVPGSLPRCIRVLVHWNTDRAQSEIEHIYIRDAVRLRPDLSKLPPVNWDELEAWISEQMQDPSVHDLARVQQFAANRGNRIQEKCCFAGNPPVRVALGVMGIRGGRYR